MQVKSNNWWPGNWSRRRIFLAVTALLVLGLVHVVLGGSVSKELYPP